MEIEIILLFVEYVMLYYEYGVLFCGFYEDKIDEEEDNDCFFKERRVWLFDERERVGWVMEIYELKRNKIKKRRFDCLM